MPSSALVFFYGSIVDDIVLTVAVCSSGFHMWWAMLVWSVILVMLWSAIVRAWCIQVREKGWWAVCFVLNNLCDVDLLLSWWVCFSLLVLSHQVECFGVQMRVQCTHFSVLVILFVIGIAATLLASFPYLAHIYIVSPPIAVLEGGFVQVFRIEIMSCFALLENPLHSHHFSSLMSFKCL